MSHPDLVSVRPLEPHEIGAFRRVARRSFGLLDSALFTARGDCSLVAVLDGGEVVGGTVLRTFETGGRTVGVVDWVFADPQRAPRGVGTTLRDHALDWFDEQSVDEIWAAIEPMNTASEALHRGAGFVPVPVHVQLARWGWHLPEILARTHVLIGTNLRVWLRRAKPDPT